MSHTSAPICSPPSLSNAHRQRKRCKRGEHQTGACFIHSVSESLESGASLLRAHAHAFPTCNRHSRSHGQEHDMYCFVGPACYPTTSHGLTPGSKPAHERSRRRSLSSRLLCVPWKASAGSDDRGPSQGGASSSKQLCSRTEFAGLRNQTPSRFGRRDSACAYRQVISLH